MILFPCFFSRGKKITSLRASSLNPQSIPKDRSILKVFNIFIPVSLFLLLNFLTLGIVNDAERTIISIMESKFSVIKEVCSLQKNFLQLMTSYGR